MRSMADIRSWLELRRQRREREALLLDLGALVYELHRQGQQAPELVERKAVELGDVDRQVRALEDAVGEHGGAPGTAPRLPNGP
jgi:hypothetical protein